VTRCLDPAAQVVPFTQPPVTPPRAQRGEVRHRLEGCPRRLPMATAAKGKHRAE
jgi:hypothetical protein